MVSRKQYTQNVFIKYQDANGNYSGDWICAESRNVFYGAGYAWAYGGDACYNAAFVNPYTVTGGLNHYIYISRKQYTVRVNAGTGISSVSGGKTYYYGAICTVDASIKTGYSWKNWSGTYSSGNKTYSFAVTQEVSLNTYYIAFHPNAGSGSMPTMTCRYDQTYTLPVMTFTPPKYPCKYLGWNIDYNAHGAQYSETQQIRNLTSENGTTIHLYAIWDYAPVLTCSDRYFTLFEAKIGEITKAELLRTATSTDREDGTTTIKVKDYSAKLFTDLSASGTITITYTTTDSRNNTTERQAKITIVDTDATKEGPVDFNGKKQYARFISSAYYQKAYEEGGLESTSKWRSYGIYRVLLSTAMNNVKRSSGVWSHIEQKWEFTQADIAQVKQYVKANGMGNSKKENGLRNFFTTMQRCRKD